jgi:hypothetical protein
MEWEADEREFSNAMQFGKIDHDDKETYVEFLGVALVPSEDEDFELPSDLVDALQQRAKTHTPRDDVEFGGIESSRFGTE